jgi:hypothetical protein
MQIPAPGITTRMSRFAPAPASTSNPQPSTAPASISNPPSDALPPLPSSSRLGQFVRANNLPASGVHQTAIEEQAAAGGDTPSDRVLSAGSLGGTPWHANPRGGSSSSSSGRRHTYRTVIVQEYCEYGEWSATEVVNVVCLSKERRGWGCQASAARCCCMSTESSGHMLHSLGQQRGAIRRWSCKHVSHSFKLFILLSYGSLAYGVLLHAGNLHRALKAGDFHHLHAELGKHVSFQG